VAVPIGASALQWLHRLSGWLLGAVLVCGGGLLCLRGQRRPGAWIASLAAGAAGVGTWMAASAYPLSAAMAHNLCAAALLFALVVASVRSVRPRRV
jgi:heme A synthase